MTPDVRQNFIIHNHFPRFYEPYFPAWKIII